MTTRPTQPGTTLDRHSAPRFPGTTARSWSCTTRASDLYACRCAQAFACPVRCPCSIAGTGTPPPPRLHEISVRGRCATDVPAARRGDGAALKPGFVHPARPLDGAARPTGFVEAVGAPLIPGRLPLHECLLRVARKRTAKSPQVGTRRNPRAMPMKRRRSSCEDPTAASSDLGALSVAYWHGLMRNPAAVLPRRQAPLPAPTACNISHTARSPLRRCRSFASSPGCGGITHGSRVALAAVWPAPEAS